MQHSLIVIPILLTLIGGCAPKVGDERLMTRNPVPNSPEAIISPSQTPSQQIASNSGNSEGGPTQTQAATPVFTTLPLTFQEGGLGGQAPKYSPLSQFKPANLKKLPVTHSSRLLFAETVIANQKITFVLDESKGTSTGYDTLIADTNFNSDFSDDQAYSASESHLFPLWSPVRLSLQLQGQTMPYTVQVSLSQTTDWLKENPIAPADWRLGVQSNCVWMGSIPVGQQQMKIAFQDGDSDGFYNDLWTGKGGKPADMFGLDRDENKTFDYWEIDHLGRYLCVDGNIFQIAVDASGKNLSMALATVKVGTIRCNQKDILLHLQSEEGPLAIESQNGEVRVPIGEYLVLNWRVQIRDERGQYRELRAPIGVAPETVRVKEGETTSLLLR